MVSLELVCRDSIQKIIKKLNCETRVYNSVVVEKTWRGENVDMKMATIIHLVIICSRIQISCILTGISSFSNLGYSRII